MIPQPSRQIPTLYTAGLKKTMELNGDKSECLHYGPNKDLQSRSTYLSYTGQAIQEKDHVKDLGVTMVRNVTFRMHIINAVLEVERQRRWVLSTFATWLPHLLPMLTLWKSLVQSKPNCCNQLWCPLELKEIFQTIEMIQRSFLCKILGMNQLTYWEQLLTLNLYSLERCQERYRIIWVRSRNCGCLVTWFCYQLIAKPDNKTAAVSWPDPNISDASWKDTCRMCLAQTTKHQRSIQKGIPGVDVNACFQQSNKQPQHPYGNCNMPVATHPWTAAVLTPCHQKSATWPISVSTASRRG